MNKRTRTIYAIAFCTYIAAVLLLCFIKTDGLQQPSFLIFGIEADKIAHFLMFLPFPVLAYATFAGKWNEAGRHFILTGILTVAGTLAAIATEYIQALLGYRSGDVNDFIADVIGIVTGGCAVSIYLLNKFKRRP